MFLSIFIPHQNAPEYLYQAELVFELKFEPIYEQDGKTTPEQAIFSKPIGIRLIKEKGGKVELYSKFQSLTEIWIRHLSKHLNQYGFHKNYKPIKKIGKGGFATVYEVVRLSDKEHFAVKAFSKQNTLNSSDPNHKLNLLNEIQMLRTFDSPNIMKCEAVFESDNSIYIVLELLNKGQLHNRINEREAHFSMSEIRQFVRGMALGLK